jgi:hypothetical protein
LNRHMAQDVPCNPIITPISIPIAQEKCGFQVSPRLKKRVLVVGMNLPKPFKNSANPCLIAAYCF